MSRAVLLRPAVRRGARCQASMCRTVVYAGPRLCAGKRLRCEGLGKSVGARERSFFCDSLSVASGGCCEWVRPSGCQATGAYEWVLASGCQATGAEEPRCGEVHRDGRSRIDHCRPCDSNPYTRSRDHVQGFAHLGAQILARVVIVPRRYGTATSPYGAWCIRLRHDSMPRVAPSPATRSGAPDTNRIVAFARPESVPGNHRLWGRGHVEPPSSFRSRRWGRAAGVCVLLPRQPRARCEPPAWAQRSRVPPSLRCYPSTRPARCRALPRLSRSQSRARRSRQTPRSVAGATLVCSQHAKKSRLCLV